MIKSKTLYILRHAKAETGLATQDDHDRALTGRGILAAQEMGKYLVAQGIQPDLVLCSTALRAKMTWEEAQHAYTTVPPTEYSHQAYLASGNELLKLIAPLSELLGSLMIVGHNPGLHQLCLKLSRQGDDLLLDALTLKFPTCAFAAIALGEVTWDVVAKANGELKLFTTPKGLDEG